MSWHTLTTFSPCFPPTPTASSRASPGFARRAAAAAWRRLRRCYSACAWSARAGVSTLVEGLNIVYREIDTRNIVLEFLASLALTALLLMVACAALLASVALPALLQFLDVGALGTRLAALGPLLILGFAVVFVIGALIATARIARWPVSAG